VHGVSARGATAGGAGPVTGEVAGLPLAGLGPAERAELAATDSPTGVPGLFAARRRADPSGPLLTYYDDATGERTELSATSLDNWVAKTANLIVDVTGGLGAGEPVRVALPAHWQSAVVLLAVWSAGGEPRIQPAGGPGPAEAARIAFVDEQRLTGPDSRALLAGVDDVVALSLRPFGARLAAGADHLGRAVGADVLDYAAEVPAHGDSFGAPALIAGRDGAARAALWAARRWGLATGERVLTTAGYDTAGGLLAGLLAPVAAGGSVVLCRHADRGGLARRATVEKATAFHGPGLPADTDTDTGAGTGSIRVLAAIGG